MDAGIATKDNGGQTLGQQGQEEHQNQGPVQQPEQEQQKKLEEQNEQNEQQQVQQVQQPQGNSERDRKDAGRGRNTSGKYCLDDFQILRTLGTGSFGRVHLVRSNHNGRFYALKVLKKHVIVKLKQVEHTNDERRMLSIVAHPFLIRMWGTFQDAEQVFMV